MDTTLEILKSHTSFGVANGATKPPEAASTWILCKVMTFAQKNQRTRTHGTDIPLDFSYSSKSSAISPTGS